MRPSFRNQLKFLSDLYKTAPEVRRKHETTAKPRLMRLEDRTVLSSTLPDGHLVDLFYDGTTTTMSTPA